MYLWDTGRSLTTYTACQSSACLSCGTVPRAGTKLEEDRRGMGGVCRSLSSRTSPGETKHMPPLLSGEFYSIPASQTKKAKSQLGSYVGFFNKFTQSG